MVQRVLERVLRLRSADSCVSSPIVRHSIVWSRGGGTLMDSRAVEALARAGGGGAVSVVCLVARKSVTKQICVAQHCIQLPRQPI